MDPKISDLLYELSVTQHRSCSETVFRAALLMNGIRPPEDGVRMMSGFSGGMSAGYVCGAVTGGVAAISYLYNRGDEESVERSKELCAAFVRRVDEKIGTLRCDTLKIYWRREDIRCYELIEMVFNLLIETLLKAKNKTAAKA